MPTTLSFSVSADEAKALLQLLGQLPTNTNVWPLMAKLSSQFDAQINSQDDIHADSGNAAN